MQFSLAGGEEAPCWPGRGHAAGCPHRSPADHRPATECRTCGSCSAVNSSWELCGFLETCCASSWSGVASFPGKQRACSMERRNWWFILLGQSPPSPPSVTTPHTQKKRHHSVAVGGTRAILRKRRVCVNFTHHHLQQELEAQSCSRMRWSAIQQLHSCALLEHFLLISGISKHKDA